MPKHEHNLTVSKEPDGECYGCGKVCKVTCITSIVPGLPGARTMNLCSKCLAWLKSKLRGF